MNQLTYQKANVIAEIGCNHKGDLTIAKQLIDVAKLCGATVAKFQKRHPKELLSEDQYNAPHPVAYNSYGDTYGAHREFLEFTIEEHADLQRHCADQGILYSTSVWDITSAQEIVGLNPELIKIPSATNTHFDLLKYLRDHYTGDIHISLGMSTREEQRQCIEFFEETNQAKDRLVVYSCTSAYPVDPQNTCLLEIPYLISEYGDRVKTIGFSGHHNGIALDISAYTLGATWIERHFTLDRTWKGTDHAASLEPTGLQKLVRDLNNTHSALRKKDKDILDIEVDQRKKLKFKG